jgi:acyl carrier protein
MEYTPQSIKEIVFTTLSTSLVIKKETISLNSRLITDLGMDSLDFLDIMFSLEKLFAVKIRDNNFDRLLRPDNSEIAKQSEFLSVEELEQLQRFLPELTRIPSGKPIPRKDLFSYITVETLIVLVSDKLQSA